MLPYLITYLCLGTDPIYNQACNQGLIATSIQLHITQTVDVMQQNIETEVSKRTGKEIWAIGLTVYQVYSKEAFIFNTDLRPVADGLSGSISKNSTTVSLSWMF